MTAPSGPMSDSPVASGRLSKWSARSEPLVGSAWAPGHLTVPAVGGGPGVVVLHDWFGLDRQARSVADRLAAEGWAAFAPDLYQGRLAADREEAVRLARALESGNLPSDLLDAVEVVRALPGSTPEPVAVLGIGFGGALALYLASLHPEVRAVVCLDGFPPPGANFGWSGVRAAVLGHACHPEFARGRQLQSELWQAGVDASLLLYPGAPHGFFDSTRPEAYRRDAAALSWQRTVRFLRQRSGTPSVPGRINA
jgi:carboxymethylenebutenolidase